MPDRIIAAGEAPAWAAEIARQTTQAIARLDTRVRALEAKYAALEARVTALEP